MVISVLPHSGPKKQNIKEIKIVEKQDDKTTSAEKTTTVTETKTAGGLTSLKKTETTKIESSKPGLKKTGAKSKNIFICEFWNVCALC